VPSLLPSESSFWALPPSRPELSSILSEDIKFDSLEYTYYIILQYQSPIEFTTFLLACLPANKSRNKQQGNQFASSYQQQPEFLII